MGCSQGKTTKPSVSGVSATGIKPPPTLLNPSSAQKLKTGANEVVGSSVLGASTTSVAPPPTLSNPSSAQNLKTKADEGVGSSADHTSQLRTGTGHGELAKPLEPPAAPQASDKDWPLRWRALRVFAMSDKGKDGRLDAKELTEGTDTIFAEMLQGTLGREALGLLSMSEWLERVKKLALQDEVKAGLFLDLCERHITKQKEHWPLRDEALQVFRMGDRNGDCQLDMNELTEINQSDKVARTMMDSIDIDKDGTVSKGEWLAYIKRLADQNEESAAALLALYRKKLSNSSNTAEAYVAAKSALDALVEDSSVVVSRPWWACY